MIADSGNAFDADGALVDERSTKTLTELMELLHAAARP
jgi:hypothetical protein